MKQNITLEQLNELSDKQKEKLRDWWKPQLDHIVSDKNYDQGVPLYVLVDDNMRSGWSFEQSMEDVLAIPLLSIGQMIEFLENRITSIQTDTENWFVNYHKNILNGKTIESEELCDALWKAVREVLNESD